MCRAISELSAGVTFHKTVGSLFIVNGRPVIHRRLAVNRIGHDEREQIKTQLLLEVPSLEVLVPYPPSGSANRFVSRRLMDSHAK
jgi:hypothetical protein